MVPLQGFDELASIWSANGVLDAVEGALQQIGFDDAYVDSAIASRSSSDRTKVIKDGTWGMVEVASSHLRLLDCPILQRLRSIHQLGFSYLTYPSAEHSRFAHSLGMFAVVSRFLREITRRSSLGPAPSAPYVEWSPSPEHILLAEHAAILHDVGHMPFSHVTEQIMHANSKAFKCGPVTIDDFIFDPEDLLGKSKLAELLSVAIILAPRFKRFYREYVSPGASPSVTNKIAALILGHAPEPNLLGLANLISGSAIDADKIDYINRDATACGIAVGIDVSRLFMRSSFLTVSQAELQKLRSLPDAPVEPEVIFVVNASGIDSIEEIGQARTMLYHRVYLHQTTRNVERLLGKALQTCVDRPDHELTNALSLWTRDDFGLLRELAADDNPEVVKLAKRVRARQLPKRASSFGRRFTKMTMPISSLFPKMEPKEVKRLAKQVVGTGLEDLRSKVLTGSAQIDLENEIADEAALLADMLRGIGKTTLEGRPLVSVLPMPSIEENRIDCIILDNEQLTLTSSSSVSDEQMEASDLMKSTGYVLTDAPWRDVVFLATRTVLFGRSRQEHDVAMEAYPGDPLTLKCVSRVLLDEDTISQRIRMSNDDLRTIFSSASKAGYFEGKPRLATVTEKKQQLADAAARLREFSGQGNWSVTADSVSAFIGQFPPNLRKEALSSISSFAVLDRVAIASAVGAGVRSISLNGVRGYIAALSPDSGGSVRGRPPSSGPVAMLVHERR